MSKRGSSAPSRRGAITIPGRLIEDIEVVDVDRTPLCVPLYPRGRHSIGRETNAVALGDPDEAENLRENTPEWSPSRRPKSKIFK